MQGAPFDKPLGRELEAERLQNLAFDPDIVVSCIDELKMMEDNLMNPKSLPG